MGHVVHSVKDGQKFTHDQSLEVVTCPTCRITYAIPESFARSARAYPGGRSGGWTICCPMGHDWHYTGKSIADQLQDERAALEEERRRTQATRDLLAHEERSHAATRGHLTRAKRRVHAGVCPVPGCKRHFKDLERHMESKHPAFAEERHA